MVAADNTGGVLLIAETAIAPTITGTKAGQTTISETAVTPFSGVTITDANNGGTDTDTLSITLSGGGTLADGAGFSGLSGSNGNYTLSGTAAAITAELDALVFTPVDGVPNTSVTTTFTLSDKSSAYGTATVNSTTTVIDSDPAVAPTITGTKAGQTTISETAVTPFSGVTITDANNGGTDTDTLSITLSGGGTLADGAGFSGLSGSNGNYTLSGTAAAITAELDALVFTPVDGVPNTSVTTTFTLSDKSSAYGTATVNSTTTVIDSDPAVAPTITGTKAGQTTISETAVTPFSGVTITDANNGGTDTDTLTITLSGSGTLSGTGLSGSNGNYTLSGTAAAITAELDALVFTPVDGVPNTSVTTTFTLSDKSSAYGTATVNSTTTVIDSDPAVAPTITGTKAGQTTISETAVTPFSGVTITDANNGGTDTDTLTITLSGGGTLADGAGFSGLSGSNGNYTLSGTAAAITAELDALVFTPVDGVPNTSVTTTFTLSDKSSAYGTATVNSTTTVIDSDPAVAPTITGTKAGQTTTSEAPVKPFSGVTITDANNGGTDTDTLSITLSGSGTLSGTGLSGSNGNYTLSGTAAAITAELDALVFTPVDGVPNTSVTTTFTLSDKSSAYGTATVNSTTTVIDSDPAVAPTITGTKAGQTTTSEAPVKPFSGVTITDANNGGTDTDTLSITLSGSGTLSGTGLSGSNGNYTLSGTAAAITAELDALVFTPVDGVPNTSVTTTFTLSDKSSAYGTATVNSTTTVIDSDPAAVPPTITSVNSVGSREGPDYRNRHGQARHRERHVEPEADRRRRDFVARHRQWRGGDNLHGAGERPHRHARHCLLHDHGSVWRRGGGIEHGSGRPRLRHHLCRDSRRHPQCWQRQQRH